MITADQKKVILNNWIDMVLGTYKSPVFFKTQKNRFANPVGCNISDSLGELLDILSDGSDLEKATAPLENIINIRAVQEFTPSQAVSFVFVLKKVLRVELGKAGKANGSQGGLLEIEEKIDSLGLIAFDLYMASKERLHRIRVRELESGTHALQCPSASLRRSQQESVGSKQTNSVT